MIFWIGKNQKIEENRKIDKKKSPRELPLAVVLLLRKYNKCLGRIHGVTFNRESVIR